MGLCHIHNLRGRVPTMYKVPWPAQISAPITQHAPTNTWLAVASRPEQDRIIVALDDASVVLNPLAELPRRLWAPRG